MPRFAAYTTSQRTTSSVAHFPGADRLVTLVVVSASGHAAQATTLTGKRAVLRDATARDLVMAAWPGQWSQDVFVVDDLPAARAALG